MHHFSFVGDIVQVVLPPSDSVRNEMFVVTFDEAAKVFQVFAGVVPLMTAVATLYELEDQYTVTVEPNEKGERRVDVEDESQKGMLVQDMNVFVDAFHVIPSQDVPELPRPVIQIQYFKSTILGGEVPM